MAGAIEVEQHQARVLEAVHRLPAETLPLHEAAGRTLAGDVRATLDIPPFENSAMDGYAVRLDDVIGAAPDTPVVLEVVADVPAGSGIDPPVAAGQAVRLMTGSPMPGAADTVVPFEETAEGLTPNVPSHVTVLAAPAARGRHVRGRADDLAVGDLVLAAGGVRGVRRNHRRRGRPRPAGRGGLDRQRAGHRRRPSRARSDPGVERTHGGRVGA